jgi:hypothetical protein
MRRILAVAVFAVLAVPFVALAQTCDQQSCGSGDPPHSPPATGYLEFISLAYEGAYGTPASCFQLQREYTRLVNAANSGTLNAEARRFVATLFMTQTSYDTQDLTTYVQTSQYEARNPAANGDRTSLESFIADLYRAFLQREPDAGGLCFWANDACAVGRKHPIRAFEESIEFGDLVNGLYDDGPPESCCPHGSCS